jgi:LacI family transcriptional regulator
MSRVSINDIARQAGVCIGTVSRVINNLDRVHPETRARIRKIIEETGYHPSPAGRALVSGKTRNVLVVLHDISDPYCAAISKLFSRQWHELGYKMLLGDSNYDPELEREHLTHARHGSVDGLIVVPMPGRKNNAIYREILKTGLPFVAIDKHVEGVKTHCVKYDDTAAARMAIEYLAGKGHRRIAFMHSRIEFQTVRDRLAGYQETMKRLNLPLREEFQVPLSNDPNDAAEAIRKLMRRNPSPTALVAENETMAMVCMNTLLQAGFKIPQDAAVMAYGDTLTGHYAPVPMTTVSLRHDLMCRKVVEILSRLMDHPKAAKQLTVQEIIQPELIVRASA